MNFDILEGMEPPTKPDLQIEINQELQNHNSGKLIIPDDILIILNKTNKDLEFETDDKKIESIIKNYEKKTYNLLKNHYPEFESIYKIYFYLSDKSNEAILAKNGWATENFFISKLDYLDMKLYFYYDNKRYFNNFVLHIVRLIIKSLDKNKVKDVCGNFLNQSYDYFEKNRKIYRKGLITLEKELNELCSKKEELINELGDDSYEEIEDEDKVQVNNNVDKNKRIKNKKKNNKRITENKDVDINININKITGDKKDNKENKKEDNEKNNIKITKNNNDLIIPNNIKEIKDDLIDTKIENIKLYNETVDLDNKDKKNEIVTMNIESLFNEMNNLKLIVNMQNNDIKYLKNEIIKLNEKSNKYDQLFNKVSNLKHMKYILKCIKKKYSEYIKVEPNTNEIKFISLPDKYKNNGENLISEINTFLVKINNIIENEYDYLYLDENENIIEKRGKENNGLLNYLLMNAGVNEEYLNIICEIIQ